MTKKKFITKSKICVIVGGTRGIGFAIAQGLWQDGAIVVICGRSSKKANEAAKKIDKDRSRVFGLKANLRQDADIKRLVKSVVSKFNRIDVLVNCAGIFKPFGQFESIPFKENIEPIEINLIGSMRCLYHIIPQMKKQSFGRIILFSGGGIGGNKPLTNASSYYTSKGAVGILAEVLATELTSFNVTINAILPGQILTDSTRATFNLSDNQLGPILSQATRELQKSGGHSTSQVIKLVNFIISDKANHLSGKLLSARWDKLEDLSRKIPTDQYVLRRIKKS